MDSGQFPMTTPRDPIYLLRLDLPEGLDLTESLTSYLDRYPACDSTLEPGRDAAARLGRRLLRGLALDPAQQEWLQTELNRFFRAED
jgi:hypothetical protein